MRQRSIDRNRDTEIETLKQRYRETERHRQKETKREKQTETERAVARLPRNPSLSQRESVRERRAAESEECEGGSGRGGPGSIQAGVRRA